MTAATGDDDSYLNAIEDVCHIIQNKDSPAVQWLKKLGESTLDVDNFTLLAIADVKERQSVNFPLLPRLFHLLRECLLNHRWSAGLQVFQNVTAIPKDSSRTIWKVGSELLAVDGRENSDLMLQLFNQMKLITSLNSKEVVMDFMTYLLSIGENNVALVKMQEKMKKVKNRKLEANVHMDRVHKAYMGLLWYLEWKKACNSLERVEQRQQQQVEYSSQNPATAEIQSLNMQKSNFWTKAEKCFDEIRNSPGVWDIFVRRHVELHIHEGNTDTALTVLKDYCETNPESLNAHKYLYDFCERHLPDSEDTIEQLQIIADLSPSDELVLKYCERLMKDKIFSASKYLTKLLDYSCWQEEVEPWKMFAKCLHQNKLVRGKKHKSEAAEFNKYTKDRESWWLPYHFSKYKAQEGRNVPNLNLHKACVASVLYGNDCEFVVEVRGHLSKSEKKSLQKYLKQDDT